VIEERERANQRGREEIKRTGSQQTVTADLIIPYHAATAGHYSSCDRAGLDSRPNLDPEGETSAALPTTVIGEARMSGQFVVPPRRACSARLSARQGRSLIWNEAAIVFGTEGGLTGIVPPYNITIEGVETQWSSRAGVMRTKQPAKGSLRCLAAARRGNAPNTATGARIAFKSTVKPCAAPHRSASFQHVEQ